MQDKKEHRAQCLDMITRWQQSGLNQKEFCAANNIAYHVFHYWYKMYKLNENLSNTFIPVNLRPVGGQEQITLTGYNGIQVTLPFSEQSARFIKQLLLS